MEASTDKPSAVKKKPKRRITIKEKTERDVIDVIESSKAAIESDINIRRFNVRMLMAALVMALATNMLSCTEASIRGFISVDADTRILEIADLSSHEGVLPEDIIRFSSDAMRRCTTFTYLSKMYAINDCLKEYFSRYGFEKYSEELTAELIEPAKKNGFDLETVPVHVPAIVSNTERIHGRAAWQVRGVFNLKLLLEGKDSVNKNKDVVIWVVREYKSKMPHGLAIHSVAMRDTL